MVGELQLGLSLPAGAEVRCATLSLVYLCAPHKSQIESKTMKLGWNLVSLRNLRPVKRKSLTVRGMMHLP